MSAAERVGGAGCYNARNSCVDLFYFFILLIFQFFYYLFIFIDIFFAKQVIKWYFKS